MASEFASQLASALVSNVLLRLLTFTLTTWLTRMLLPSQVGISFSYEVYVDAMLFIGREAVRCVTSRYSVAREKHAGSSSTSRVFLIDRERLIAMLNTSALIFPSCLAIMAAVELLGGIFLPVGGAFFSWMWSSWHYRNTDVPIRFTMNVGGENGFGSLVPSLSHRLWPAFGVGFEFVSETQHLSGERDPSYTTFLGQAKFFFAVFKTLLQLMVPEILVWSSVLAMALVEPCIALFSSLDLFRTTVLAEALSMIVRQVSTLVMVQFWLSSFPSPFFTTPAIHAHCVASSFPDRCEEAYQRMDAVQDEWRVRLVFSMGVFIYGASLVLFYAIACGKGFKRWRWLLGVDRWLAPTPPSIPLSDLISSPSVDSFFAIAPATSEKKEEKVIGIAKGQDEVTETNLPALKPRTEFARSVFPVSFSYIFFPLFSQYVDYSLMRAAFHYHRRLLHAFFLESLTRLALTEGTNFALFSLTDAASRGCFQTISRLGSLLSRLVFRIWENACLAQWSRLTQQGESGRQDALRGLSRMLRISFYVGFLCSWLGPLYSQLLLHTLYAGKWSTAGMVASLQYYCHSLGPMAWNGLLECFVRAIAHPKLLKNQQMCSVVISAVYVVSSYALLWNSAQASVGRSTAALDGPHAATSQETCDGTTVLPTLLFLQRTSMIARIVVSFGLILSSDTILPSCRSKRNANVAELAINEEKGMTMGEKKSTTSRGKEFFSFTILSVLWKDLLFPLWSPSFIPLALLFLWTRTPAFFPPLLLRKVYMPPLLAFIFVIAVVGTDRDVRNSILSIAKRFLGKK